MLLWQLLVDKTKYGISFELQVLEKLENVENFENVEKF